jgi:hypothetical protein
MKMMKIMIIQKKMMIKVKVLIIKIVILTEILLKMCLTIHYLTLIKKLIKLLTNFILNFLNYNNKKKYNKMKIVTLVFPVKVRE